MDKESIHFTFFLLELGVSCLFDYLPYPFSSVMLLTVFLSPSKLHDIAVQ